MKSFPVLGVVLLALSLLMIPVSPLAITGCSTSVNRKSVNTLFTAGATVDAAYKSYLDLVVGGQLKTNDVPKVSRAYTDFQKVFAAAVEIAAFNTNAPPSPEIINAQSQVLLTIKSARGK